MPEDKKLQLNNYLTVLKNGNADILDAIYALVGGRMYALAKSISNNAADAEDILHESFIKIVKKIGGYKSGTNAYAWIMKITRNTALDFLRRKKVRAEENIDEFFNLTANDYDEDKLDTAITLETAMKKLSEEERKLIYYSYYLDMPVRGIAKITGKSKSAVARAIVKAEQKLKIYVLVGTNEGE